MSFLREYKRFYLFFPVLFVLAEMTLLSMVIIMAQYLSGGSNYFAEQYLSSYVLSAFSWLLILLYTKDFKIGRNVEYGTTFNRSLRFVALLISIVALLLLFTFNQQISKLYIASFFGLLVFAVPTERILIHFVLNKYRQHGGNFKRAVIIGYDELGISLYNVLNNNPYYGIKCQGFYDDSINAKRDNQLGTIDEFLKHELNEIDFIYVSEKVDKNRLNDVLWYADMAYKKVKLLPSFKPEHSRTYTFKVIDNVSIIDINALPLDNLFNRFVKRSFDVAFSLMVSVLILSWLFPLIALIVRLESKGPIFFRQLRNGKNNHPFVCYKFRTMVENDEADSKWATKNDPRITRFGAFLRKTSIDELPQFINVLKGDMAIVGPRPLPIKLNEQYRNRVENFLQRHTYKPGITGLAQSMGYRGEIKELYHIKNRVKLDRFYLQNWSFIFDLKIIAKTIWVLIKGQETAY
jgi:putative colanic acid biosynthesis UDP-glucose lipid carrier transferase